MRPSADSADGTGTRFPRARGDAPVPCEDGTRRSVVPPRTRGCAHQGRGQDRAEDGSPAHAGMRPGPSPRRGQRSRFPRARGDAPGAATRARPGNRVPPRTRGCAFATRGMAEAWGGSPAHAGMRPTSAKRISRSSWFPRARGDAPTAPAPEATAVAVPPRTRGCARGEVSHGGGHVGSPAHAGMRPAAGRSRATSARFPRARGDAPLEKKPVASAAVVPPRTRGCAPPRAVPRARDGASPAHAGMRPAGWRRSSRASRFPRARGDAPVKGADKIGPKRVPPRTRGCAFDTPVSASSKAGSPAHAGMRPARGRRRRGWPGFPRARGDAPVRPHDEEPLGRVPPRTRGCAVGHGHAGNRPRGSPAHAGMRPTPSAGRSSGSRFPRARGDAPATGAAVGSVLPVPPRTRGCAHGALRRRPLAPGSPAHAGMRPSRRSPPFWCSRFPRARGDAPSPWSITCPVCTVPPRTRGCALARQDRAGPVHGSPAHAGMRPPEAKRRRTASGFPRARGDAPPRLLGLGFGEGVPPRTRGCAPDLR